MLVHDSSLDWQTAQAIAQAACEFAIEQELKVCVWVIDRHGNPLAMQRINHTPLPSTDIARNKAYTAVSFGFGTHQWEARLKNKDLLLSGLNAQKDLVLFGGGLPIRYDGNLVGAIGVSGASDTQDQACAQAGINAVDHLTWE